MEIRYWLGDSVSMVRYLRGLFTLDGEGFNLEV